MKKLLSLLALTGILTFGSTAYVNAQEEAPAATEAKDGKAGATIEDKTFHQSIKEKFIEGDPIWMAPVLICLIIGLAVCIERIIYLNMASTNTHKLLNNVEQALASGGVEAAKEVCRSTRGPVASIFFQALDRSEDGVDMSEKAIVAYGGVQTGLLEKGLSWIALFIALAPMLGFLGTVIGMIQAFDRIEIEKNISPDVVAGGIKVALLTTVAGLIVAMILQLLYNYIISKIDNIVNQMEDSSISMMDLMLKHNIFPKN